jgi:hypothetical protein
MKYLDYRYLWPPRPSIAQAPNLLGAYHGWWAQAKMNGICLELAVSPNREIIARTRHGDVEPSRWQPGPKCGQFAALLPAGGWYVFVGELLHTRGVGVKDTVYLFDVLVDNGDYLVGVTHADRQERLARLVQWPFAVQEGPYSGEDWSHVEISPGFWLTRNHKTRFRELWDQPPGPHVEGLVLKDPRVPLALCSNERSNSTGMVKFRYPTDQLNF